MEAKLRNVTKALPNLQIVRTDAQQLSEMIAHTSKLAENVSAKVRKLDDARVRNSKLFLSIIFPFTSQHFDSYKVTFFVESCFGVSATGP